MFFILSPMIPGHSVSFNCNPTSWYLYHLMESFCIVGVVFAEMILGTAEIFNVDQRTAALISHRMRHASKERQEEALKLAAMAEMCIYHLTPFGSHGSEGLSMFNPMSSLERALQVSRKYLSPTVQTPTCGELSFITSET
jgi:hypothetical protein